MPQNFTVGQEAAYMALPGTVRAPGNAAQSPKTVRLAAGTLTAQVDCSLVGRYDRSGCVNEQEIFRLAHDIEGARASLEIQRFVKAVRVTGTQVVKTSGAGYLAWGAATTASAGRDLQAICASTLRSAGLQDDGPRGNGKVFEAPDRMGLEIRDSPGMAASLETAFPYALFADFIMRIIVRPQGGPMEVAEFRYQTYFELVTDPYPGGMRDAAFVPRLAGYGDYQPFDAIATRFEIDRAASLVPVPAVKTAGGARASMAPLALGGKMPVGAKKVGTSATLEDLGQVKKKNFNDMV